MCNRQGMFFVDVQALVMNGKPLDRKAFELGQTIGRNTRALNLASLRSDIKGNATAGAGNEGRSLRKEF